MEGPEEEVQGEVVEQEVAGEAGASIARGGDSPAPLWPSGSAAIAARKCRPASGSWTVSRPCCATVKWPVRTAPSRSCLDARWVARVVGNSLFSLDARKETEPQATRIINLINKSCLRDLFY